jgi:hypothetical protein
MSVNIVSEHALPKSSFLEGELSASGSRIASEPERTVRAELSDKSSPSRRSPEAVASRPTSRGRL